MEGSFLIACKSTNKNLSRLVGVYVMHCDKTKHPIYDRTFCGENLSSRTRILYEIVKVVNESMKFLSL